MSPHIVKIICLVMRTFIYSFSNVQIYHTILLTTVTMLHIQAMGTAVPSLMLTVALCHNFPIPFLNFSFSFFTGWIMSEAMLQNVVIYYPWPTTVCSWEYLSALLKLFPQFGIDTDSLSFGRKLYIEMSYLKLNTLPHDSSLEHCVWTSY